MATNACISQLGQKCVQVHTEERRRKDCTLTYSIPDFEAGALVTIPSDKARLVQIDTQYKTQDHSWKFSFNQLTEELLEVYLVKRFREV